MLRRTIYFGQSYFLHTRNQQLVLKQNGVELTTIPIEDVGTIVLDHPQISISTGCIDRLLKNNVSVVYCDDKHLPKGILLPIYHHHIPNQRARNQLSAKAPLKKQLWQQVIRSKILNQANVLEKTGKNPVPLNRWANEVRSGDPDNKEAQASKYYWHSLFKEKVPKFSRDRLGPYPNALLNYGYTILRSSVARALVGTGLVPIIGIHHHNKYNPFCLADDMMEPYRPYVDMLVYNIVSKSETFIPFIDAETKRKILELDYLDVKIGKKIKPMQLAILKTIQSLAGVFEGENNKIVLPKM